MDGGDGGDERDDGGRGDKLEGSTVAAAVAAAHRQEKA